MYACAELFCVLTNVSNKFVFRRFPQRSRPLSHLPLAWAPGRRFYVWATRETYQDRRWFNSRTKNKLETRRNAQMKGSDSIIRFSTWFLHEKQHTCPIPAALSRSLRFHCKVVSLLTFSVHRTQVKNARRKIPSVTKILRVVKLLKAACCDEILFERLKAFKTEDHWLSSKGSESAGTLYRVWSRIRWSSRSGSGGFPQPSPTYIFLF